MIHSIGLFSYLCFTEFRFFLNCSLLWRSGKIFSFEVCYVPFFFPFHCSNFQNFLTLHFVNVWAVLIRFARHARFLILLLPCRFVKCPVPGLMPQLECTWIGQSEEFLFLTSPILRRALSLMFICPIYYLLFHKCLLSKVFSWHKTVSLPKS